LEHQPKEEEEEEEEEEEGGGTKGSCCRVLRRHGRIGRVCGSGWCRGKG
jgi:hypothetical protein